MEILKWLREQGCTWDVTTATAALSNGQFRSFKDPEIAEENGVWE